MNLTEKQVDAIKEAVKSVRYGSVTIQISADKPDRLELNVQNRIRLESEATEHKDPMDRNNGSGYRT